MKTEYKTTSGRVIYGQPLPDPIAPPGDGWVLQQTAVGHDEDGKPAHLWQWRREVPEAGDDEELRQA